MPPRVSPRWRGAPATEERCRRAGRCGVVAVVLLLTLAGPLLISWESLAGSRAILTRAYTCTTAITTLTSANSNRVNLTLINVGTIHVGISGQMHTNATLAADGFFTLHVGSSMELANYQGGLACTAAGSVQIHVMEEVQ